MGSMFCDLHVSLKITSSGDTNSTNLPYLTYVLQVVKFDSGNSSLKNLCCIYQICYVFSRENTYIT